MSTIREALAAATEQLRTTSTTARLDAELLLAYLLDWTRVKLLAEGPAPLEQEQAAHFAELIARRAALEPLAYIVGRREFYGLELLVDQRVLIPRPETELLVELALARAYTFPDPQITIADICTGSGAIALALASHLPRAQIVATDIAPGALEVAAQNLERHGLAGRVQLLQGDLLDALSEAVDIIVCNPPYTILSDVDEGVFRYEPHLALDGGPDGLELYRRIAAQLPGRLRGGGALLLEIGATQAIAVTALLSAAAPGARLAVQRDLAGHERVVSCWL